VNVGVFGGTFDPPHVGHLIVAQDAALALELDRILFVPAGSPPHKLDAAVTDAALRAEMLQLAIGDDRRFAVDAVELERPGPSFTVETLRLLRERVPAAGWTLFMGADQYAEFGTWREPDQIRRLARIAVLTRSGAALPQPVDPGAGPAQGRVAGRGGVTAIADGIVQVDVTRIDISATEIRRRVAAGQPIRYLVPAAVEDFIHERRLYSRNGPVSAG
jgi:nicotinate-nucleotide adenylyltransferase